ncbi:hypothetical protein BDZ94DRAFT_1245567 [Collybia nuda]|uniref:Secreted protein n=1 Tax=Collybia nuda TaxID=64659 RepID=A0A9P5YH30_9AGAR|nr:hypothetical protein BDZ94DRAFT_1245567 [Collybia nuda]
MIIHLVAAQIWLFPLARIQGTFARVPNTRTRRALGHSQNFPRSYARRILWPFNERSRSWDSICFPRDQTY